MEVGGREIVQAAGLVAVLPHRRSRFRISTNAGSRSGIMIARRHSSAAPACLVVPIVVQGPLLASMTRRPSPLVAATRTPSTGQEGVPHRAASFETRLGRVDTVTVPEARRRRPPPAQRTPDPAEPLVLLFVFRDVDDDPVGGPIVFQPLQCHGAVDRRLVVIRVKLHRNVTRVALVRGATLGAADFAVYSPFNSTAIRALPRALVCDDAITAAACALPRSRVHGNAMKRIAIAGRRVEADKLTQYRAEVALN